MKEIQLQKDPGKRSITYSESGELGHWLAKINPTLGKWHGTVYGTGVTETDAALLLRTHVNCRGQKPSSHVSSHRQAETETDA